MATGGKSSNSCTKARLYAASLRLRLALHRACALYRVNLLFVLVILAATLFYARSTSFESLRGTRVRSSLAFPACSAIAEAKASSESSLSVKQARTLVIYTTSAGAAPLGSASSTGSTAAEARGENLDFFLQQGLLPHDPDYHFVIVVAGLWPEKRGALEGAVAWAQEHGVGNVEVVWRLNSGLDFCSYLSLLGGVIRFKHQVSDFSSFLLLNGSVRGPLLPGHWQLAARAWPDAFLNLLRDGARLAGTSINCGASQTLLHIQSMVLAFGARDLSLFLNTAVCTDDFDRTVAVNEIGLTQAFLRSKANLGVLQLAWRGADFQNAALVNARCEVIGRDDVYYPAGRGPIGGPQGVEFNPLELIFFKNNRGINLAQIARYTEWQLATLPCALPNDVLKTPATGPEPVLL